MPKGKLVAAHENETARKIREAIGAGPNDVVEIVTPQFERTASMPPVKPPPALPSKWHDLRAMTKAELKALGCGNWDGRLMLFPKEWYDYIPEGFAIESINGDVEKFQKGVSDDDMRYGCLPYGVPAVDGVETDDD